ncbi:Mu transposase C-terminal domain-containing protein [Shinella yambaruensis]|uniref:Transposase n=1 Tax=Shinella yambaruensis TaxID=415996 RepID=A0ABQ5ZEL3_9HYPH|nr:transposase domain-containing protein [Shinella yambaruensis]MCJ8027044.1 Mu transposase C-terminal domain-containing protein [Shinella yambaruensis]MCU7982065.1 Mu transposase C-terminal domain-containing protein [Shinella yambaruensis]GLR51239.1 transposase [Shinella yambaruensis]
MKEWFTLAELLALNLPDLPTSERSLYRHAQDHWNGVAGCVQLRQGKTRPVVEYHVSLLPASAQWRLRQQPDGASWEEARARKNLLWSVFNRLPKGTKDVCEARLKVLVRVEQLVREAGLSRLAAIGVATHDAGIQKSAYYEWRKATEGLDPEDWLPALVPSSPAVNGIVPQMAECHPDAWDFLKSDYLRPEKPGFSACYRRLLEAAAIEGWSPIPSERSLRRRMEAEVPKAIQVVTREGRERAKTLYPSQRRNRTCFHAMEAVNMDGHQLDLFIRVPHREKPIRMYLVGIQDLYSNKILSWRLDEAETWEVVRLVVGDMVESFGIPEDMYIDNGRAFASKKISGGAKTRYRFKVRPEDPEGLLVALKIKPHFVLPKSGQSKPIERAWGDFAEDISKHPVCAGAYTGKKPTEKPDNYMRTAIDIEDLKRLIAHQVAEHNARTGRKTQIAKGRSFDAVFEESMQQPTTIVRRASEAQRFLWLLASETIKTHKGSGAVHFAGNRYWSRELNQHMGDQVTIRFDPDDLHGSIKVYDLKNRFICDAACIADTGFKDQDEGRVHARGRAEFDKATRAAAAAEQRFNQNQLAAILRKGQRDLQKAEPVHPKVTRIFTGKLAPEAVPVPAEDFEQGFSKAMARVAGASVHAFPRGDKAGK